MPYVGTSHPKKHNKGMKRRLRLLMVVFLCFISWALLTWWDQLSKYNQKTAELNVLQQKANQIQQLHDQYEKNVAQLHDKEYIEQKAREEYRYVRPGETLFYVPKSN